MAAASAGSRPSPGAAPPKVLPWRIIVAVIGVFGLLLGPVFAMYGSAFGGVTLIVGLIPGFAGHVVGRPRCAGLAAIALLALVALDATLTPHNKALPLIGAVLLILAAGVEARFDGGRAFVLALYGWCAFSLSPNLPTAHETLPFIALGLLWGAGSTHLLGITGSVALPAVAPRLAISLSIFLLLGVFVSTQVTHWLHHSYGYWVVLLFVMRALSPHHQSQKQALRYGLGAVAGSGCAYLLALSHAPGDVTVVLALVLVVVGLRLLPHPTPWSPAAFTSAVLLLVPVGTSNILVRLEATLIAVGLTVALVAAIGFGWRLVGETRAETPQTPPQT